MCQSLKKKKKERKKEKEEEEEEWRLEGIWRWFPPQHTKAGSGLSKVLKSSKPFLCGTTLKFTRNWEFEMSAILSWIIL